MPLFLILLVIGAVLLVTVYNTIIRKRNLVKEAWSGIDVQLKRRYDLLPNLVQTVKGYAKHEKDLFERVTKARAAAIDAKDVRGQADAENSLTSAIKSLFAVAENYTDLKASQNFIDLQKNLAQIEEEIQMARRYYNGTAREFNTAIQTLPGLVYAYFFNFKEVEYFEIETAAEKKTPDVQF